MVENDQSVYWDEEEDGSDCEIIMSDILNNKSSHSSGQNYLNEESVIKNFSVSHQGGDAAADSSSGSKCPIGLRLNKTPSFLNLVQMSVLKGKSKTKSNDSVSEKLKAGNFPAASIKIGNWKRFSRHEGDLTAKLYFAKRKLVWEVLEGALKYKIEMQWSDITAIRGITPETQPGTLEIELSEPPLYFQEHNPQPRKHTLWQQTSDFTGGQASVWRRHVVSFKPGILDKHYEKLLQCNQRLFDLSLKPFPSHGSPYFDPTFGISEISLNFNKPYESSYYQGPQYPNQSYNSAPPMPAMNFITPPQQQAALWDQAYDHNSQYPNYYQPPLPNVGILNEIENHFLGDQSHVPSPHHDQGAIHVEPLMGSLGESTDVINPGYSYANYSSTGYQYQDSGNNAPITDGFYAQPQGNWNTPPQHYTDNNGIANYQGSSSLDSFYYQGYNPTGGNFF